MLGWRVRAPPEETPLLKPRPAAPRTRAAEWVHSVRGVEGRVVDALLQFWLRFTPIEKNSRMDLTKGVARGKRKSRRAQAEQRPERQRGREKKKEKTTPQSSARTPACMCSWLVILTMTQLRYWSNMGWQAERSVDLPVRYSAVYHF